MYGIKRQNCFLFPDLSKGNNAYKLWSKKAEELEKRLPDTKFIVSDFLELIANETERSRGCDLADYLIKYDWRTLRHEHCIPSNLQKIIKKNPAVQTLIDALDLTPSLAS